jgi:galactosamine-6-phosphate isomerase
MQGRLLQTGPIDICMLGIGFNGHIALNEPAESLQPRFHVAELAPTTLNHTMVTAAGKSPTYGLTMGVGDILQSKMILLLISGPSKREIAGRLLSQRGVTSGFPASFLLLHPNTVCLIDRQAAPDQAGNQ